MSIITCIWLSGLMYSIAVTVLYKVKLNILRKIKSKFQHVKSCRKTHTFAALCYITLGTAPYYSSLLLRYFLQSGYECICRHYRLLPYSAASVLPSTINPLALELDIYILVHHLCKMWIFYEPRRVTLGNTRHFVEE